MRNMKVTEIPAGATIGYLEGVVRFESYNIGTNTMFVSLGRIKNKALRGVEPNRTFEVFSMPAGLGPWFGV